MIFQQQQQTRLKDRVNKIILSILMLSSLGLFDPW